MTNLDRAEIELTSRVVRPAELRVEELDCWREFCKLREDLQTAFLAPEFTLAVDRVRADVHVCIILRNQQPVGFLPFQFATKAHRALGAAEPAGAPMNDYFGLIAAPGLALSSRTLLRLAGLEYLGFTHLDEAQLGHGLEAEKPEPGLQIHIERGGPEYWEELRRRDRKFADDTTRRERRMERDLGPIEFQFSEDPQAGHLARLLDSKRGQYRRSGAHDIFAVAWRRKLLETLVESVAPHCRGTLSTLYAGKTWVASHFGLRCGRTLHYWFPVYNRELHMYAPGRLLLKQIILRADSVGVSRIDRGSGFTQAKREFANYRHTYYRGAWYQPGVKSTLYRLNCSLRWRLAATLSRSPRPLDIAREAGI